MKFTKKLTALASCAVMAASMVGSMPAYATSTVDTNEVIAEHHIDLSAFSEDGINSTNASKVLTGVLYSRASCPNDTWRSCVYAMYTYNGPYTAPITNVDSAYAAVCGTPYVSGTLVSITKVRNILNNLVNSYGYTATAYNSLSATTIKNRINSELPILVRGTSGNDIKDFLITGYSEDSSGLTLYYMDYTNSYGTNLLNTTFNSTSTVFSGYTWSKAIAMS